MRLLYELTKMVAIGGQRRLMLCSATWWLRELNAFMASMSRAALHSISDGYFADWQHCRCRHLQQQ